MSRTWRESAVEEIAAPCGNALATGPFGSAISAKYFLDEGVPVIRGSNLSADVGRRLVLDDLAFLSLAKAQEFRRSAVRKGDLVFTCWGTIGQVGFVDGQCPYDELIVSNKQMKLTPDPTKADGLFLYYLFSSPAMSARIRGLAIGSSVPGFNLGQLRSLNVLLPPLPEQHPIAGVLGALDDKIELNRRMNETLEAIVDAIFTRLFETAPLRPFTEIVEVLTGGTPSTSIAEYWGGGIPWFSVVDTPAPSDVFVLDTERTLSQAGLANSAAELLPAGTTIITARGTVGNVALMANPMAINQSCYGLQGRDGYGSVFTLYSTRRLVAELRRRSHGSVFDTITLRTFDGLEVPAPGPEETSEFEDAARPYLERILANLREARTLAALRDALLPKLISGELRIRDVERAVEQATLQPPRESPGPCA